MSVSVSKIVNLAQAAVKFLVKDEIEDEPLREYKTIGGVFSDTDYSWLSNGPRLEVVHTKTGCKVGAWTFGWVLKDSNTQVVCVEEIQRPHGRLPLLAVGVDCDFSGGMLCIFDFITSKVIRAIQIRDKITTLHVVDAGYDVFTLPGPLRNFDGIIAVGTAGGDVFLIDICRQICDEALTVGGLSEIRDELNPCQLNNITSKDVFKIEFHKEFAVRNSQHLAIHLNVVLDQPTRHFTLKGPKGDDRIHVNKDEVTVSALYYCPQLGSLLIGYNFGALQLYNLMNLELVYTSPVCDEHIPISHFAIQEPADDPRAFCYIWAVYSASERHPTCLPLAVMYAFCYHTKEYHEGYGFLYQDFNIAAVHYQMELGVSQDHKRTAKPLGGYCLALNSINQGPINKGPHHDSNEDSLTLCALVWNVWYNKKEIDTFVCLFDLNQWYKEQMPPSAPNTQYCSTFMIQMPVSNLINSSTNKSIPVIDIHIDRKSLRQFTGAQRLEEHFCPNSISFGMCSLRASDIIHLQNFGVQKALLAQIESSGPLCLVEPAEMYQEIIGVGLIPLFIDLPVNTPITTNQQREIILGTALENQLMGWLCKCASEWANGSYVSTGCSLDFLVTWAFQRAIALKTNCDNFCIPLFDHSETRLDSNANNLLNSCTRQLKNLWSLYAFMIRKLYMFISNQELVNEQYKSLEMVSVYFEVLQWLLNVGLLPECPLSAYPRSDDMERVNAPYPAEMLSDFYNHRRGLLQILNEENFSSSDSVLFIDTLIERECGGKTLQEQWRNDGGNGLYPPPSLQSLLRTYLIDNVDLSYKHSVIIYVFLDLAMTLDQARYKPVITYLIKFPAVFKVSPSLIKITQAFWQLDHGDYNTAMGLLLDPLILNNDLNQWHHKVALRSLLVQKQHNFALLYVQVRKPTFKDDEDIMTAISLYVANNLLDEAFYFEKRFVSQPNGDRFLLHLFKECTKNNKIRSIIYRSLTTTEEKCFLKYLLDSKHPSAEDLHVYYHILRSHYIEAFESHDRSVPNQIENQGLIGQESAIPREKLVYSLKKLLPDVTRNLLSLCQKEKNSVWQQVSKPAPMSVFVHSINDKNVQYKSSSIGVALSKAKQTFNDTLSDKFKIETENTPFLRTPRTSTISKRTSKVVITPKVLDTDQSMDDISSHTPAKRLKLSPRVGSASLSTSIPSKLNTPLVKRKVLTVRSGSKQQLKIATPHSILKVKSDDTNQFEDDFKTFEKLEYTPISSKKSGLGLSPRKSLAKPSPVVRFEGLKSSSSSSLNASRSLTEKLAELSSTKVSPTNSYTQRLSGSSKNTSTEEDIFYSPDTSIEEANETRETVVNEVKEAPKVKMVSVDEEIQDNDKNEIKETKGKLEEEVPSPVFSPKSRRSYKRTLGSVTPVRSSPRLAKTPIVDKEMSISSTQKVVEEVSPLKESAVDDPVEETISSTEKTTESTSLLNDSTQSSVATLPKLRPRRSLCRKVLETNAINRVLSSPVASPRSRRRTEVLQDQNLTKNELTPRRSLFRKTESPSQRQGVSKTEESTETVDIQTTVKYADGEESHKSSFMTKHSLTTSFVELDSDTSGDFSMNSNLSFGLKLSSPVWRCLNSSNKSVLRDSSSLEGTVDDTKKDEIAGQETLGVDKIDNKTPQEGKKTVQEEHDKNIEDYRTTTSERDQSSYSVYDSSCSDYFNMSYKESGPKFSESMMRCIYGSDVEEKGDKTPKEDDDDDDEIMDVDDIEETANNEEKAQVEDPPKSPLKEVENKDEFEQKDSVENSPENVENTKKEVSDGGSSNRTVDPEMNVFEISDDLSINKELVVDKEVTFEENDLCYDQQNTLENVLEENITSALEENISVTSTPLKVLEKKVFIENLGEPESSEEESDDDVERELNESFEELDVDEEQEEDDFDKGIEDTKQPEETKTVEIIEIGSSSDENEINKEESSEYDSERSYEHAGSDEEKLEVSYERNIYDSEDDYSSESSYERRHSEVSDNSDDSGNNEAKSSELFYGDIILVSDNKGNESSDGHDVEEEEEESAESEIIKIDEDAQNKSNEINEEDEDEDEIGSPAYENIEINPTKINEDQNKEVEQISEDEHVDQSNKAKLFSNYTPHRLDEESVVVVDNNSTLELNQTERDFGLFHGEILFEKERDDEKNKAKEIENASEKEDEMVVQEETMAESVEEKGDENLPLFKELKDLKNQQEHDTVTMADIAVEIDKNLSPVKQLEDSKVQQEQETVTMAEDVGKTDEKLPHVMQTEESEDQEKDTVTMTEIVEEIKEDENLPPVSQMEESGDQNEHDTVTLVEGAEEKENLSLAKELEESKDHEEHTVTMSENTEEKEDKNMPVALELEELKDQEEHTVTMSENAEEKEDENLPLASESEESKVLEQHTVALPENAEGKEDENLPSVEQVENSKDQEEHVAMKKRTRLGKEKKEVEQQQENGRVERGEEIKRDDIVQSSHSEGIKEDVKMEEQTQDDEAKHDPEISPKLRDPLDATIVHCPQKFDVVDSYEVSQETEKSTADVASNPRTRSNSVSGKAAKRTRQKSTDVIEESLRRSTRRTKEVTLNKLEPGTDDASKTKSDIFESLESQQEGPKQSIKKTKEISSEKSETDDARKSKTDIVDSFESQQEDSKRSTKKTKDVSNDKSESDNVGKSKTDIFDSLESQQQGSKRSTKKTKDVSNDKSESDNASRSKTDIVDSCESQQESSKRSTKKSKDVSIDKSESGNASKSKSDTVASLESEPVVRVLRSRRVSTEEKVTPALAPRKRSASVDDTKIVLKVSAKKEKEVVVEKSRSKRAASVSRLPQIAEESDVKHVERKRSKSVLANYSEARRVTRQQLNMLKKVEEEAVPSKISMDCLDPIVFLDRLPFEGKPDPEEKKVYETSPSSSTSAPMTTRRRARSASVSSVNSDNSNASETGKGGRQRTKVTSQSALPGIQEEPSEVPKKRTRKNSSHK